MSDHDFPPPGFEPDISKIPGIDVYKPKVEPREHQEVVEFNCPQCGAATAYSIPGGGIQCTYCGFFQPSTGLPVGREADEFEFKTDILVEGANGWGDKREQLSCQKCGFIVSLPPGDLTHTCPYCGANTVIQRQDTQDILRPLFLLPFKIEQAPARSKINSWISASWMTPAGLNRLTQIKELTRLYLPFWTFDSRCMASWKAEVGHLETERYFQDGEWKTRTKTVWRWESGDVDLTFDDYLVLGTDQLSVLLIDRASDFDLNELVSYEPSYLAGFQAKAYDTALETAWETSRNGMREQTMRACHAQASTSQVRNFSMKLDFAEETWRYILLPFYMSTFNFTGKTYQVFVNGQTGSISGQRPVDWRKVWLVIAAILFPGLLAGIIGLLTIPFAGFGVLVGGLGFFLLIIGLVISFIIFQKAQKLDDA